MASSLYPPTSTRSTVSPMRASALSRVDGTTSLPHLASSSSLTGPRTSTHCRPARFVRLLSWCALLIVTAQVLYVRFCVQFGYALSNTVTYHTFAVYNNFNFVGSYPVYVLTDFLAWSSSYGFAGRSLGPIPTRSIVIARLARATTRTTRATFTLAARRRAGPATLPEWWPTASATRRSTAR